MKRFIAFFLVLFLCQVCLAQVNRAIIIGIEDYPTDSGWNRIHAHNDLAIVKNTLLCNGFLSKNIIELCDDQATLSAIRKAFRAMSKNAMPGDSIIIIFSCHGQRITDINGDEEDGFDEALIPIDACVEYGWKGYKGEKHLIDDELNAMMMSLRESIGNQGYLLLLLDSCHSGDADRDVKESFRSGDYRGADVDFILPSPNKKRMKIEQNERKWTSFSACLFYQTNYEIEVDGSVYGRLVYSFCNAWVPGMSDYDLAEAIRAQYKSFPKTPKGFEQVVDCYIYEKR